MHFRFRKFWGSAAAIALATCCLSAQETATDPELSDLLLAYQAKVKEVVKTPLSKAQAELDQNYTQALDRAQQDATLKGKLEEAEALRTEKAAVAENTGSDLPALPPNLREVAALRKKYLDAVQALRTSMQKKLEPLQKELVRQLEALAVRMVRAGKGDAALEARQLAKDYAEQPAGLDGDWQDQTKKVTPKPKNLPIVLKKGDSISTVASFKPPVEIEVVAKIDKLDLRLGYAADQLIFNWERRPDELRIDGGPADRIYTPMMGEFPQKKFAVIRWCVEKDRQTLWVDGKQRFEHQGDYSKIDRPVSILAYGSEATVQSIKIRRPAAP
ncbi:MAG: hypothetical protein J0L73_05065 [Verrucomicrobia bacterium]|nr:hypothetical protein [Verrucomicrobiota bacterium]